MKKLNLKPTKKEGIKIGTRSDGKDYSVRESRKRYFFPDEWESFIKTFKNKEHRFFFICCVHTGGRIMEVLNIKHEDIDIERGTIRFRTTKQRKAKRNYSASSKDRSFFVASNLIKEYKSFIRGKIPKSSDYIFLDNSKLPDNYDSLDNFEKRIHFSSKVVSYSGILKRKLKKAEIKDYYNFSPHNIRKTYGMWMRALNIEMAEICYRMGHDMDTFIAHYGSSLIFTPEERRKINKIFGEVK